MEIKEGDSQFIQNLKNLGAIPGFKLRYTINFKPGVQKLEQYVICRLKPLHHAASFLCSAFYGNTWLENFHQTARNFLAKLLPLLPKKIKIPDEKPKTKKKKTENLFAFNAFGGLSASDEAKNEPNLELDLRRELTKYATTVHKMDSTLRKATVDDSRDFWKSKYITFEFKSKQFKFE